MSEELKPCPFCGSADKIEFRSVHAAMQCQLCGSEGPSVYDPDTRKEYDLSCTAWNRRSPPTTTEDKAS